MIAQKVAQRYTKALFQLTKSHEEMESVLLQAKTYLSLQEQHPQLKAILVAPQISKAEKMKVLTKVCKGKVDPHLLHFLLILLEKDRLEYLPEIVNEYEKSLRQKFGIVNVRIITSIPVDAEKKEKLKGKLEKSSGKKIELEEKTDPGIEGGGVLIFGNQILDNSVKGKLTRLKNHLYSHNY
jgi:F-type H+-transporting ATPase subunit delta